MFCGPIMSLASAWKSQIPGGIVSLSAFTVAVGATIFSYVEGVEYAEAIYASIIAGE